VEETYGYFCVPGGEGPGRSSDHQSPTSAEVKEIVDLQFYFTWPSWLGTGWDLFLPVLCKRINGTCHLHRPSVFWYT